MTTVSRHEAEELDLFEVYRQWVHSLLEGHKKKNQNLFEEAQDLYQLSLHYAITLVEELEHSLKLNIQAFKHLSSSAKALAEFYQDYQLVEEARHMLVTHFIILQKMMGQTQTPLYIRDLARREIYRSKHLLHDVYQKLNQPELAEKHLKRCREIYYTLLH